MAEVLEIPYWGTLRWNTTPDEEDEKRRRVIKLELEPYHQKNVYDLQRDLPGEYVVVFNGINSCNHRLKRVSLCTPDQDGFSIAATLHEVGHAREVLAPNFNLEYDLDVARKFNLEDRNITFEYLYKRLESEQNAWKYALDFVREMELTPEAIIETHKIINSALRSYNRTVCGTGLQYDAASNSGINPVTLMDRLFELNRDWLRQNEVPIESFY